MKPLVIIINGKGGSGKDYLIEGLQKILGGGIVNISAIDAVKEAAKQIGWNGEKGDRDRKFLSDLKKISIEYNDWPIKDIMYKFHAFIHEGKNQILFIHIREPEEIEKCKKLIKSTGMARVKTLLVTGMVKHSFGNRSDDGVNDYKYDIVFVNTYEVPHADERFIKTIKEAYESTT